MESLIGTTLSNRYQVVSFLGRGVTEVYKVWDRRRTTHLAMKILPEDMALDRVFLRSLERDAQALEALNHPNIVRSYGLERDGHVAFLLMDFINGITLKRLIFDAHGPLPLEKIRTVLSAVCSALNFAHKEGYIHCDIKPGNIMIEDTGRVLLTDFGIARMADTTTMTMAGAGTPAYMAPEQVQGLNPSPQTDIYALGILLYEMLTGGERPFTGKTASITGSTSQKVCWEHVHAQPTPIHQYNPSLPKPLEDVVLKCMAKDPAQRFSSVLDLLNSFQSATQNEVDSKETASIVPTDRDQMPLSPKVQPVGQQKSILWIPLAVLAAAVVVIGALATGLIPSPWGKGNASPTPVDNAQKAPMISAETDGILETPTTTPLPTLTPEPTQTPIPPTITNTPLPTLTFTPVIQAKIVEPYCDKFGDSPVDLQEHQPVILKWRWDAMTPSQVQDHIQAGIYRILLDGQAIQATSQSEIINVCDDYGCRYQVYWLSDPIHISPGTHLAERYLSWSEKIFDGWDWFGPGSPTETQYHNCEIIVR